MTPVPTILAQDSIAVEAQIALFVQNLLSPVGVAGAIIGLAVLVWAIVFRRVFEVTAGIAAASVMFQLHPDALTQPGDRHLVALVHHATAGAGVG